MDNKITATFDADISELQKKTKQAEQSAKSLDKSIKGVGSGDSVKGAGAHLDNVSKNIKDIDGIAKGGAATILFKEIGGRLLAAAQGARDMRDKLIESGQAVPPLVNAAAQVADNWDKVSGNISKATTVAIGGLQKGIEYASAFIITGFDPKETALLMTAVEVEQRLEAASKYAAKIGEKTKEKNAKADQMEVDAKERNMSDLDLEYKREKEVKQLKAEQIKLEEEKVRLTKEISKTDIDPKKKEEGILRLAKIDSDHADNRIKILEKEKELEGLKAKTSAYFAEGQKQKDEEEKKRLDEKAKAEQKVSDAKKKSDEEESKRIKELKDLERQRIWEAATEEQKLNDIIKRGRDALQKVKDNPQDTQAKIDLEKSRKELRDFQKGMTKTDTKKDGLSLDSMRDADGKIRSRGVIVSDEDRKRTLEDRARNMKLSNESSKIGRIGSDNKKKVPVKTTEELLTELIQKVSRKNG